MRVPDCFNVIVVQEAPHVTVVDRLEWCQETDPHHFWTTGGAALNPFCVVRIDSGWGLFVFQDSCLGGSQDYRRQTRMTRPTHSVTVATTARWEVSFNLPLLLT